MSKDLFQAMRERELATNNFLPTKKELISDSQKFAKELLDSGEYDETELYCKVLRLSQAFSELESTLKSNIKQEDFEAFGVKGKYKSGGQTLNYTDDPVYAEIKKELTDRAELLKVAYGSEKDIYDDEGVQVPKVSVSYRKSGLTITY